VSAGKPIEPVKIKKDESIGGKGGRGMGIRRSRGGKRGPLPYWTGSVLASDVTYRDRRPEEIVISLN